MRMWENRVYEAKLNDNSMYMRFLEVKNAAISVFGQKHG